MKSAFLIVDMQKEYYRDQSGVSMKAAAEYIEEVAGYYRKAGEPVIWIQDQDDDEGVVPGTEGFEIIDELKPLGSEVRIIKKYGNSFNKTKLDETLKNLGVDTVIISGYCAEHCVLSTYRGALDYDYTPFLLKNGIAGGNPENLKAVESISDTVPYKLIGKMLLG